MGERIVPRGYVELRLTMGSPPLSRTVKFKFLVVDCPSAYNTIIERPTLDSLGVIESTHHLAMKFITDDGEVCTIRRDQAVARKCYKISIDTFSVAGPSRNFSLKKSKKEKGTLTEQHKRTE